MQWTAEDKMLLRSFRLKPYFSSFEKDRHDIISVEKVKKKCKKYEYLVDNEKSCVI